MSDWVKMNVGGQIFCTTISTLEVFPNSMLSRLCRGTLSSAKDETGAILIDRDPVYFRVILNFLRHQRLAMDAGLSADGVLAEAEFFGIEPLIDMLSTTNRGDFSTRSHFISLMDTLKSFSGLRLVDLDLSKLRFGERDFEGSTLSHTSFAGAYLVKSSFQASTGQDIDFSEANMEEVVAKFCIFHGSSFQGARLVAANLGSSDLYGADFSSATCNNALVQRSRLCHAKFMNADLCRAKLQHCDLRGANFTGANLESTMFTGADIRGAIIEWDSANQTAWWRSAKVTQQQYDEIDLPDDLKEALRLVIVEEDSATINDAGVIFAVAGTNNNGMTIRTEPGGERVFLAPEGTLLRSVTGECIWRKGDYWRKVETVEDPVVSGWCLSNFLSRDQVLVHDEAAAPAIADLVPQ